MTEQQVVDKPQDAIRTAQQLFESSPDWVTFYREVMGVDGIVRKLYPTPAALAEFEKTDEYAQIQHMLAKLRSGKPAAEAKEPIRVITVRLPRSLHEALKSEAYNYHTSMNQLCISKLLQFIDSESVPTDQ